MPQKHTIKDIAYGKTHMSEEVIDLTKEAASEHLIRMYGLTKAEARLALEVTGGLLLKEISARRNISIHTLRTHLKSIFVKMKARRQSDMVRKVMQATSGGIFKSD